LKTLSSFPLLLSSPLYSGYTCCVIISWFFSRLVSCLRRYSSRPPPPHSIFSFPPSRSFFFFSLLFLPLSFESFFLVVFHLTPFIVNSLFFLSMSYARTCGYSLLVGLLLPFCRLRLFRAVLFPSLLFLSFFTYFQEASDSGPCPSNDCLYFSEHPASSSRVDFSHNVIFSPSLAP